MKKKSLKKSGRKKISGVNVVGYLFCGLIALVCLISREENDLKCAPRLLCA